MGELRDRMVRDMQARDFSPRTVEAYTAAVRELAKFFRKAPDGLSDEEIWTCPGLVDTGVMG